MKLVRQTSTRQSTNGHFFSDLFVVWEHNGKPYSVRVEPSFKKDYKLLRAQAENIPSGEMPEKYL